MVKRVLLVDDEPQLRYSVKEFLCRVGYDVTPAENGAQALGLLVDAPPDLIVSDILMEEMDGFEFQKRVHALTADSIPFIFLTAKGELRDRLEGLHGGADDYIIKPFEPEELEARMASVLSRVERTRREEKRDSDGLRNRIAGEISKQLRTPVTSLMAHLNLVLSERCGDDATRQEHYLRNAVEDANALRGLVEDLSWLANEAPEEMLIKRELLRIAPLVRGAAANAAKLASHKGITLHIACGGLLSAAVDGSALNRALAELLEAVVRYSAPGGTVTISAARTDEGGLEFVITDSGKTAVPEEDPFDLSADALDIARRVVKAHGGRFATRCESDGRRSMVVWLPGRMAKHIGKRK